jgi:hypothetical protein
VIGDGKPESERSFACRAYLGSSKDTHREIFELALIDIRHRVAG